MTNPTLTEAVYVRIVTIIQHNFNTIGAEATANQIMAKLAPLLSLMDEMHAVTDGCGHAVSLSADYRKARAALIAGAGGGT